MAPLLLGSCCWSCAAGHLEGPERDAIYREIQLHEAAVARAEVRLLTAQACLPAAQVSHSVCDASRAVCSLSARVDERDAALRCLRVSDACSAARAQVDARGHADTSCATHAP